jgi:UDP-N-acetylmuramate dehydrogenase
VGGAQISPLHANFILNVGGATAHDVLELIRLAQARVAQLFGVRLEPEVQFVGRWQPSELCGIVEEVA